jgi:hypothetical protein
MKTWDELTEQEQVQAVTCWMTHVLKAVCEGDIRFDDAANGDDTQALIEAAAQKAEDMHTPWFTHEYIMADDEVRQALLQVALASAEEALYVEPGQSTMSMSEVHNSITPNYIQEFMKEAK